jgi:pyruvate/2-oxoglutarate dehydrogenase complex dihydrolipoamide dehydrogenase (E3) component
MDRQYDLVVVGTGVTSAVASRCREAGSSVVDRQPFGGTCAHRRRIVADLETSAHE